jgi:hypothetical protein
MELISDNRLASFVDVDVLDDLFARLVQPRQRLQRSPA